MIIVHSQVVRNRGHGFSKRFIPAGVYKVEVPAGTWLCCSREEQEQEEIQEGQSRTSKEDSYYG